MGGRSLTSDSWLLMFGMDVLEGVEVSSFSTVTLIASFFLSKDLSDDNTLSILSDFSSLRSLFLADYACFYSSLSFLVVSATGCGT